MMVVQLRRLSVVMEVLEMVMEGLRSREMDRILLHCLLRLEVVDLMVGRTLEEILTMEGETMVEMEEAITGVGITKVVEELTMAVETAKATEELTIAVGTAKATEELTMVVETTKATEEVQMEVEVIKRRSAPKRLGHVDMRSAPKVGARRSQGT